LIRRLEQSVEKLEKAQDLLGGKGAVSEANLFQYIDCTEDLARVYYWRARVDLEHQTAFWTEALGLLGEAKELIEHIHDRDEYPFLLGKIYHQYARIYRAQGDNERAAKHYARSAGLLEKYSHYLPELRKTVADACDWLYELSLADEVERSLVVMSSTSEEEDLESIRLQEWIDDRLLTRFGIGWPDTHRRR
jgi:tetratricopeptide (TPR) repeat protein